MPGHFHFYTQLIVDDIATFTQDEYVHMINVLRYAKGEHISFTNGLGNLYKGTIQTITKKEVFVTITEKKEEVKTQFLTLAIGFLKNMDRMELMVEKLTELNVHAIWLIPSANSQRKVLQLDRLIKKAISAVKQSHGAFIPTIEIKSLASVLQVNSPIYIAYCKPTIGKANIQQLPKTACVLLGPEGDFTDEEIEKTKQNNAIPLDLGTKILRTETAAIAIASVHYLC